MSPSRTNALVFLCIGSVSLALAERAFFGDPPDTHNPWAVHDRNRPAPPVVQPASHPGDPPSDAIVLFDGTQESFKNWRHERPDDERKADWFVSDGALVPRRGADFLRTVDEFGDCQLHLEWAVPENVSGKSQGRGNSGIFLMGMVEIQILDNYENPTYADGMAGAIYGFMPPAVNALKPPGQWQSFDIIFRRPIVRDGVVLDPGSLTVLANGVVVQDGTPIHGGGAYRKRMPLDREFPRTGPLKIQDHGDPVRFRNIWVRPLRPRELDGGTDGRLTEGTTQQKRRKVAEEILDRATGTSALPRALLLLESLIYTLDAATLSEAEGLIWTYLHQWPSLSGPEKERQEQNIKDLYRALEYLEKHKFVAPEYPLRQAVEAIARRNGWLR